jgi:hypothetical protein
MKLNVNKKLFYTKSSTYDVRNWRQSSYHKYLWYMSPDGYIMEKEFRRYLYKWKNHRLPVKAPAIVDENRSHLETSVLHVTKISEIQLFCLSAH